MRRRIDGFHQDEQGDWVAELSCLHAQHVRHRPPFEERPWVLSTQGRAEHVDSEIDCPLCDRAELPSGLRLARTAGPFDNQTLPSGLLRTHEVGDRTWGLLRVIEGRVELWLGTEPPLERRLQPGDEQALPPRVPHRLTLAGPAVIAVDFLSSRGSAGP